MKKNELTLGMRVENNYGREGTVIAINSKKEVWVQWTRRDSSPYPLADAERAKDLHPVGTYDAALFARAKARAFPGYQAGSNIRIAQIEHADLMRGRMLGFWGDYTEDALRIAGRDDRALAMARLHYRATQAAKGVKS